MPVPIIKFTKTMTCDDRQKALNTLRGWFQSAEANEAPVKGMVLQQIMDYATKINALVVPSRFFSSGAHVKDSDWVLCDTIFGHADLAELLFLKYIINQINLNKQESELDPVWDKILSIAQKQMDTLIIPVAHKVRNAAIGVACFSLAMRFSAGLLVGAIGILCSEQLVRWRIARSLDNALALKETGGKVSRVEDGYDDAISGASKLLHKGYQAAAGLFNKEILASIVGETKETLKPLLENKK